MRLTGESECCASVGSDLTDTAYGCPVKALSPEGGGRDRDGIRWGVFVVVLGIVDEGMPGVQPGDTEIRRCA